MPPYVVTNAEARKPLRIWSRWIDAWERGKKDHI